MNPRRREKEKSNTDVNNVGKTNQGNSHVTFVDTAKITQSFAFIHTIFIIKDIGVVKHQEEVTIEFTEEVGNFDCRLDLIINENKQKK